MKIYNNYPLIARVRAAETFRTPKNLFLKCLICVGVVYIMQIAEGIGMGFAVTPNFMDWVTKEMEASNGQLSSDAAMEKFYTLLMDPQMTQIMLFCTGLGTITIFLYCRLVEGRKLGTIGFQKKGALVQYLIGLAAGFVMFSLIVLISLADGGLVWNGFKGGSVTGILLALIGFGIQGMSEEVLCRGYFMTTVLRHQNVWWAVGLNSVFFGLMHALNSGFSVFAMVNLTLFGVMISLYVLRTDNLWGACAIHSIWNFVQGNFYGLPVSGIDAGTTVFSSSLNGKNALLNGGDFGLEASIGTTIVLLAATAILLFVKLPFAVNDTPAKTEDTAAQEPQA